VTQRSILTIPVTLLAVAALAAPVWASDDEDDGDDGQNTPTTPFVQAPAPAPLDTPAAPPAPAAPAPTAAPAPKGVSSPEAAPESVKAPKHKTLNRGARRQHRHAVNRQVAGRQVAGRQLAGRQVAGQRTVRATRTTSPVALRSVPRGGVQAGAGGMAGGR
jgi:hypothetical protein